ncbi:MAG: Coenzyme F420 hydrogenase/dehydrogenase, beta subunit C-terminal domain [Methanocellales archaeon]|nr:Coenzyme F420 hydrogenase/dehydrogenase, beta subunit C-terminal domain [Methanocellales archaeon]
MAEVEIQEIVDAGKCTGCGGCATVCTIDAITIKDHAVISEECTECDACSMVCPVIDGFPENEFDNVLLVRSGRSNMPGQDGAVVTGMVKSLLAEGHIDCAIGVTRDEVWQATPLLITDVQDVVKASGTKYTNAPVVSLVKDAIARYERVAVVGTPCQAHSAWLLRNLAKFREIAVIIGLFCMESFTYDLCEFISGLGIELRSVRKMDFDKGSFVIYADDERRIPIKEIKRYARPSCHHCRDFSAYYADISVGSVGSPPGWSTILIRTENGRALLGKVKDIEYGDANLDPVKKSSDLKRRHK